MTEQEAKNELIKQAKESLKNLKEFADDMESAILGDDDVLLKIKSTQLIFLQHFIENHLSDMVLQGFAAYKNDKLVKDFMKGVSK